MESSKSFAQSLDKSDNLKAFREKFFIPKAAAQKDVIYLCGNSLGLQPKAARDRLHEELEDWKDLGVEGHARGKRPWRDYHEHFAQSLADLVGAKPEEVVAMNSLTVNLHLMMISFYQPANKRRKIMIEAAAFPSDRYAAASQIRLHGGDPEKDLVILKPRPQEDFICEEDILSKISELGEELALVLWPGVHYYTGQFFPMQKITEAAHRIGAKVGFDLAHAAGNLPMLLHDWNVDFAAWCSYKYLNGGPGAVGGAFIHQKYFSQDLPRLEGWWGHRKDNRFTMPEKFEAIPTAEAWAISNPPIFSLTPLLASFEIFKEAGGMATLRAKSAQLTRFTEFLIKENLRDQVCILTPSDPAQRGCQVSMRVVGGKSVHQKLIGAGVICDWREPDVIRIAPVPLYNSFEDVFNFYQILKGILK